MTRLQQAAADEGWNGRANVRGVVIRIMHGVMMAIVFVAGSGVLPILAQPAAIQPGGNRLRQSESAAPTVSSGEAPTRRFEAGGSIAWPGLYGGPPDGAGGWFTVGAGRWRLQIDYLHRGQHKERSMIRYYGGLREEYTSVDGWTADSLFLFAVRHFRADRRIKTHLLFGAGYYGFRGYFCEESRRRLEERPVSYPDTCDRNQGRDSGERRVLGALGAGIETAYGSRFFLRVQTRGIIVTERHSEGSAWLSILVRSWQAIAREMVVGVGVRF